MPTVVDNNDESDVITSKEKQPTMASTAKIGTFVAASSVPMPKHMPFPEYPGTSELVNELIMFLFISGATILQFINIYRTSWWLPDSYTNHTVNVHLIEPFLMLLILLITSRRLIYCAMLRILDHCKQQQQQQQQQQHHHHHHHQHHHGKKQQLYKQILKFSYGSLLLLGLGYCVFKIFIKHTYVSLFFLAYPLIVYLLIFGFQMEPFLRTCVEINGAYFNSMPLHCCSANPTHIRTEVETLRNDFNKRFKQIIFTSVLNAYYAGLVPCMLAGGNVYYNVVWAAQHIIFIWLSAFTMCTVFIFPAKYSDILHRASLHLGFWQRLDTRADAASETVIALSANAANWCKNAVCANASLIKHNGGLYRSHGPVTVAEPGDLSQQRFYKLFHNPTIIYMTLTTAQAAIILVEIIFLCFAIEWHFLLSITFVAFTNQFTFFKIMRDYLITKRLYNAESAIILTEKHD